MDTYSSGEDLVAKTRKPYTITKQRERWTDEEHNRFLEALKLYGRAWQRIEEHIGTKTAVQIRSHAQKFFSKLEKEALVKGIPIGQAIDIEIPPPRPKRKPNNPYPRKNGVVSASTTQVGVKDGKLETSGSLHPGKQVLDLEKEPLPEKRIVDGGAEDTQDNHGNDLCSEFTIYQETPPTIPSAANKSSGISKADAKDSCNFTEFIPPMKSVVHKDKSREPLPTDGIVAMDVLQNNGTENEMQGGKNLEKEPLPEKRIVDGGAEDTQDNHGNDLCSEFTIYQETPPTIPSAANKSSGISKADAKDSCNFTEFIPPMKSVVHKDKSREPLPTDGIVAMDVLQNNGTENEMQGGKNFPRHVPVHILDGSARTCSQALSSDVSFQEPAYQQMGGIHHPALFANPAATESSTSRLDSHHKLSSFHSPFHPFRGTQEDYASLLQTSSTFSSLIVSTLLQNPAAHAAAIFAASSWPPPPGTNAETSTMDSYHGPMNPNPGMAAIAAATIAAATAWWAAHGLLPVCTPYHHAPASTATATHNNACHPAPVNVEIQENNNNNTIQNCSTQEQQLLDRAHNSELKSPTTTSSSDSGDRSCPKVNNDHEKNNPAAAMEHKDSNKNKNVKLVDRSSCGSNSSSETDVLEKHEEDKEENKEADPDEAAGESSIRRGKNSSSFNDSWKEVSEVGRMAFKALFLREILPQSFSPPQDMKIEAEHTKSEDQNRQIGKQSNEGTSLDLNSNITESCSSHHEMENRMADDDIIEADEGLLTIGLSQGGKLKTRRTGFKPYKRCSMEARESRMPNTGSSQDQEKCPKRLRLGEEALS